MRNDAETRQGWTGFTLRRDGATETAIIRFRTASLRAPELLTTLEAEFARLGADLQAPLLVIDFSGVEDAPTAVLGLTLQLAVDAGRRGIPVNVCSLGPTLRRFFGPLEAHHLVGVRADLGDALR